MSLTKNQIKYFHSLQEKKFRQEHNEFLVEGFKMVNEALILNFHKQLKIKTLLIDKNFLSQIEKKFLSNISQIFEISSQDIEKISSFKTPQTIAAVIEIPHKTLNIKEIENSLTLVLDRVQDPGNLGTILRIADYFGFQNIVASLDTVDIFNSKTIQSSMGAIFRVKFHYSELTQFLTNFKTQNNSEIYGTFLEGENIYHKNLQQKGLILLGNESAGISQELTKFISQKISIPAFSKEAESLNVAMATAVVCSEFKRRTI